jgi:hypothetical protein
MRDKLLGNNAAYAGIYSSKNILQLLELVKLANTNIRHRK